MGPSPDRTTRRRYLRGTGVAGLVGLAGCPFGGNDGSGGGGLPTAAPTPTETEPEACTNAHVSDFTWEGKEIPSGELNRDEIYYVDMKNEGHVGGTVTVTIEFWRSEEMDVFEGSVERSVSMEAWESKDVVLRVTAPTAESNWASISVSAQDCR